MMTGTGTQDDPYIVINADELIEATSASEGSSERYVKLGADINMDGHVNVNMYFYDLDGDGHSITNINAQNTNGLVVYMSASYTVTIRNVSFTSCSALQSGAVIQHIKADGSRIIKFHNCSFSVKITSSACLINGELWNSFNNVSCILDSCVIDITYTSDSSMNVLIYSDGSTGEVNYSWCHINIDAKVALKTGDTELFNAGRGYFDHCYFTGTFEFTTSQSAGTSNASIINGKCISCYAAIQGLNVVEPPLPIIRGSVQGTTFYDSDIYDGGSIGIALTTEQCKDIEYLNSIGFDVVPGE